MLFILSGATQTGKTRWLTCLVENLECAGVKCFGVLSPGKWKTISQHDGLVQYEKLGIDSVLLPQKEKIAFAQRRDLAEQNQIEGATQSTQAQLRWVIGDAAIERVNTHLTCLDETNLNEVFFVVDELGWLEIGRNQGFTAALDLLDNGPTPMIQHALIVVRPELIGAAEERFSKAWPKIIEIDASEKSAKIIEETIQS